MGLRNIQLKEEYRSDRDDIFSDFIVPCLTNCIEYDRCIGFVSLNSLTTLAFGFDNFAAHKARLRVICGHKFHAFDLSLLSRIFSPIRVKLNGSHIQSRKIKMLEDMVNAGTLEIKVAIPNSEEIVGSFSENVGIFIDEQDNMVVFSGTANETFSGNNKNFESIDVFTSWNDKTRVEIKVKDFEELWSNKTKYVDVYDFCEAEKHNLLKYSTEWAVES